MIPSDQPEQSGRAVIVIIALSLLINLGAAVAFVAEALSPETPARQTSSLGAGDSDPGDPLPPLARVAP